MPGSGEKENKCMRAEGEPEDRGRKGRPKGKEDGEKADGKN